MPYVIRVSLFIGSGCLISIHLGCSKSEPNNVADPKIAVEEVAAPVPEATSAGDPEPIDPALPGAPLTEIVEAVEAEAPAVAEAEDQTPLEVHDDDAAEGAVEATHSLGEETAAETQATGSGEVFEEEFEEESEEEKKTSEAGPTETDEFTAEIIELHLRARGGVDKIKTLKTLKIKGTLQVGKSSYNMTWVRRAPGQYREKQHYRLLGRDHITVRAYDRNMGWVREISPKAKPPTNMAKGEAAVFALIADFYGPLVDWKEKGHNFAYQREVKVYDSPTFMVKGKLKDGPVVYYYFDTKNFLLRRVGFKDSFGGAQVDADYIVTKMKRVNGVWMAQEMEYLVNGSMYKKIIYDEIVANEAVADDAFALPVLKEFWLRQTER